MLLWVIVPLPPAVVLLTATHQYEAELRTESDRRLAARAKDSGLEVYGHLVDARADLRSLAAWAAERDSEGVLPATWEGRFSRLLATAGHELPEALRFPSAAEAAGWSARMASGEAALIEVPGTSGDVTLWLGVPLESPATGALWAELRPDWLWKAGALPKEGGVTWLLLGAGGKTVVASSREPDAGFVERTRGHAMQGMGGFEWDAEEGGRWRARFATIPVGFDFGHPGLVAAVGEVDRLGAQAATLRRTSWLVAILGLLVVALLAGRRLRGDLEPISALLRQADRLAQGNLDARVELAGAADLAMLGAAFNRMAERLQRDFHLLRAAERRLADVVASSPAVLYTLTLVEGMPCRVTWTSENVRDLFGYPPGETRSTAEWVSRIHPDDREPALSSFQQQLAANGRAANELRIRHHNDSYLWVQCESRQVVGEDGERTEVVGACSDVTERKLLEAQVRQAQRMEALGQLAAGVAHDFNNLLTIISGYSELVADALPAGSDARELVAQIRDAGDRGTALTRQLLAFSRQSILEPMIVDLGDVVRGNEQLLRRLIGESIRLSTRLDPGAGSVKVDPGQVSQVLMNLASNARDAMPAGGELTIRTEGGEVDAETAAKHPAVVPGRYVVLAVGDTGSGMTPEVQARIFEPFFTTKGPTDGTGLGLATVHGIVQQSGGFVEVESVPGEGTVFRLYFPATGEAAKRSRPVADERPHGGRETILLVEDESAVRRLIQRVLEEKGYGVLAAGSGGDALHVAEGHQGTIHLVVSDVVMPGMGGSELVDRLRRSRPELRALFISGYTDDAVLRQGILRDEVAFLQKPFTLPALAARVREVLDGARPAESVVTPAGPPPERPQPR
jgi:PAS domain S-box-containing protein